MRSNAEKKLSYARVESVLEPESQTHESAPVFARIWVGLFIKLTDGPRGGNFAHMHAVYSVRRTLHTNVGIVKATESKIVLL